MRVLDLFRPVPTWSVEKVREFLRENRPEDYHLLDVRQPGEYLQGHLPGAQLVPVRELFELRKKLDPTRPVIVYCSSGIRSRAVASILISAGFAKTVCLEGGFDAWHGELGKGLPEIAMTWFLSARSPAEFVALAWSLEEGTRQFYSQVEKQCTTPEVREFYAGLVSDEEGHQRALRELYEKFVGHSAGEDFPFGIIDLPQTEPYMEGVITLSEALHWVRRRPEKDILELTMAVEAVAYDRYLFMLKKQKGTEAQRVFRLLAAAERRHLEKVTQWFERLALPLQAAD